MSETDIDIDEIMDADLDMSDLDIDLDVELNMDDLIEVDMTATIENSSLNPLSPRPRVPGDVARPYSPFSPTTGSHAFVPSHLSTIPEVAGRSPDNPPNNTSDGTLPLSSPLPRFNTPVAGLATPTYGLNSWPAFPSAMSPIQRNPSLSLPAHAPPPLHLSRVSSPVPTIFSPLMANVQPRFTPFSPFSAASSSGIPVSASPLGHARTPSLPRTLPRPALHALSLASPLATRTNDFNSSFVLPAPSPHLAHQPLGDAPANELPTASDDAHAEAMQQWARALAALRHPPSATNVDRKASPAAVSVAAALTHPAQAHAPTRAPSASPAAPIDVSIVISGCDSAPEQTTGRPTSVSLCAPPFPSRGLPSRKALSRTHSRARARPLHASLSASDESSITASAPARTLSPTLTLTASLFTQLAARIRALTLTSQPSTVARRPFAPSTPQELISAMSALVATTPEASVSPTPHMPHTPPARLDAAALSSMTLLASFSSSADAVARTVTGQRAPLTVPLPDLRPSLTDAALRMHVPSALLDVLAAPTLALPTAAIVPHTVSVRPAVTIPSTQAVLCMPGTSGDANHTSELWLRACGSFITATAICSEDGVAASPLALAYTCHTAPVDALAAANGTVYSAQQRHSAGAHAYAAARGHGNDADSSRESAAVPALPMSALAHTPPLPLPAALHVWHAADLCPLAASAPSTNPAPPPDAPPSKPAATAGEPLPVQVSLPLHRVSVLLPLPDQGLLLVAGHGFPAFPILLSVTHAVVPVDVHTHTLAHTAAMAHPELSARALPSAQPASSLSSASGALGTTHSFAMSGSPTQSFSSRPFSPRAPSVPRDGSLHQDTSLAPPQTAWSALAAEAAAVPAPDAACFGLPFLTTSLPLLVHRTVDGLAKLHMCTCAHIAPPALSPLSTPTCAAHSPLPHHGGDAHLQRLLSHSHPLPATPVVGTGTGCGSAHCLARAPGARPLAHPSFLVDEQQKPSPASAPPSPFALTPALAVLDLHSFATLAVAPIPAPPTAACAWPTPPSTSASSDLPRAPTKTRQQRAVALVACGSSLVRVSVEGACVTVTRMSPHAFSQPTLALALPHPYLSPVALVRPMLPRILGAVLPQLHVDFAAPPTVAALPSFPLDALVLPSSRALLHAALASALLAVVPAQAQLYALLLDHLFALAAAQEADEDMRSGRSGDFLPSPHTTPRSAGKGRMFPRPDKLPKDPAPALAGLSIDTRADHNAPAPFAIPVVAPAARGWQPRLPALPTLAEVEEMDLERTRSAASHGESPVSRQSFSFSASSSSLLNLSTPSSPSAAAASSIPQRGVAPATPKLSLASLVRHMPALAVPPADLVALGLQLELAPPADALERFDSRVSGAATPSSPWGRARSPVLSATPASGVFATPMSSARAPHSSTPSVGKSPPEVSLPSAAPPNAPAVLAFAFLPGDLRPAILPHIAPQPLPPPPPPPIALPPDPLSPDAFPVLAATLYSHLTLPEWPLGTLLLHDTSSTDSVATPPVVAVVGPHADKPSRRVLTYMCLPRLEVLPAHLASSLSRCALLITATAHGDVVVCVPAQPLIDAAPRSTTTDNTPETVHPTWRCVLTVPAHAPAAATAVCVCPSPIPRAPMTEAANKNSQRPWQRLPAQTASTHRADTVIVTAGADGSVCVWSRSFALLHRATMPTVPMPAPVSVACSSAPGTHVPPLPPVGVAALAHLPASDAVVCSLEDGRSLALSLTNYSLRLLEHALPVHATTTIALPRPLQRTRQRESDVAASMLTQVTAPSQGMYLSATLIHAPSPLTALSECPDTARLSEAASVCVAHNARCLDHALLLCRQYARYAAGLERTAVAWVPAPLGLNVSNTPSATQSLLSGLSASTRTDSQLRLPISAPATPPRPYYSSAGPSALLWSSLSVRDAITHEVHQAVAVPFAVTALAVGELALGHTPCGDVVEAVLDHVSDTDLGSVQDDHSRHVVGLDLPADASFSSEEWSDDDNSVPHAARDWSVMQYNEHDAVADIVREGMRKASGRSTTDRARHSSSYRALAVSADTLPPTARILTMVRAVWVALADGSIIALSLAGLQPLGALHVAPSPAVQDRSDTSTNRSCGMRLCEFEQVAVQSGCFCYGYGCVACPQPSTSPSSHLSVSASASAAPVSPAIQPATPPPATADALAATLPSLEPSSSLERLLQRSEQVVAAAKKNLRTQTEIVKGNVHDPSSEDALQEGYAATAAEQSPHVVAGSAPGDPVHPLPPNITAWGMSVAGLALSHRGDALCAWFARLVQCTRDDDVDLRPLCSQPQESVDGGQWYERPEGMDATQETQRVAPWAMHVRPECIAVYVCAPAAADATVSTDTSTDVTVIDEPPSLTDAPPSLSVTLLAHVAVPAAVQSARFAACASCACEFLVARDVDTVEHVWALALCVKHAVYIPSLKLCGSRAVTSATRVGMLHGTWMQPLHVTKAHPLWPVYLRAIAAATLATAAATGSPTSTPGSSRSLVAMAERDDDAHVWTPAERTAALVLRGTADVVPPSSPSPATLSALSSIGDLSPLLTSVVLASPVRRLALAQGVPQLSCTGDAVDLLEPWAVAAGATVSSRTSLASTVTVATEGVIPHPLCVDHACSPPRAPLLRVSSACPRLQAAMRTAADAALTAVDDLPSRARAMLHDLCESVLLRTAPAHASESAGSLPVWDSSAHCTAASLPSCAAVFALCSADAPAQDAPRAMLYTTAIARPRALSALRARSVFTATLLGGAARDDAHVSTRTPSAPLWSALTQDPSNTRAGANPWTPPARPPPLPLLAVTPALLPAFLAHKHRFGRPDCSLQQVYEDVRASIVAAAVAVVHTASVAVPIATALYATAINSPASLWRSVLADATPDAALAPIGAAAYSPSAVHLTYTHPALDAPMSHEVIALLSCLEQRHLPVASDPTMSPIVQEEALFSRLNTHFAAACVSIPPANLPPSSAAAITLALPPPQTGARSRGILAPTIYSAHRATGWSALPASAHACYTSTILVSVPHAARLAALETALARVLLLGVCGAPLYAPTDILFDLSAARLVDHMRGVVRTSSDTFHVDVSKRPANKLLFQPSDTADATPKLTARAEALADARVLVQREQAALARTQRRLHDVSVALSRTADVIEAGVGTRSHLSSVRASHTQSMAQRSRPASPKRTTTHKPAPYRTPRTPDLLSTPVQASEGVLNGEFGVVLRTVMAGGSSACDVDAKLLARALQHLRAYQAQLADRLTHASATLRRTHAHQADVEKVRTAIESDSVEAVPRVRALRQRARETSLGISGRAMRERLSNLLHAKQRLEAEVIDINDDIDALLVMSAEGEVNDVNCRLLEEQKRALVERLAELETKLVHTEKERLCNYDDLENADYFSTALHDKRVDTQLINLRLEERRKRISDLERRLNNL